VLGSNSGNGGLLDANKKGQEVICGRHKGSKGSDLQRSPEGYGMSLEDEGDAQEGSKGATNGGGTRVVVAKSPHQCKGSTKKKGLCGWPQIHHP
jgi:hypothetical protein